MESSRTPLLSVGGTSDDEFSNPSRAVLPSRSNERLSQVPADFVDGPMRIALSKCGSAVAHGERSPSGDEHQLRLRAASSLGIARELAASLCSPQRFSQAQPEVQSPRHKSSFFALWSGPADRSNEPSFKTDQRLLSGWNKKHKQRKLLIIEAFEGSLKRHLMQTPELLRLIHSHNQSGQIQDTVAGSVKLRDLRQICAFHLSGHRPSVEPRRNCILINLIKIRCVLLHDRILVIPPQRKDTDYESTIDISGSEVHSDDGDEADFRFLDKLKILTDMRAASGFEFSVLEAVLIEETKNLADSFAPVKESISRIIADIARSPGSTKKLRKISEMKRKLNSFEDKCKGIKTALREVLDNEEDVRRLEISRFWIHPNQWDCPDDSPASEDAEILLECYDQEVESLLKQISSLDEELEDALQLMELHLASVRNTLIKSELGLELIGVAIAAVAAVAGIFGMNVPNGYEEAPFVFWPLTRAFTFVVLITVLLVIWLFRKVKL